MRRFNRLLQACGPSVQGWRRCTVSRTVSSIVTCIVRCTAPCVLYLNRWHACHIGWFLVRCYAAHLHVGKSCSARNLVCMDEGMPFSELRSCCSSRRSATSSCSCDTSKHAAQFLRFAGGGGGSGRAAGGQRRKRGFAVTLSLSACDCQAACELARTSVDSRSGCRRGCRAPAHDTWGRINRR